MRTYTELLPHQAEAVEKLKNLKIGALYMEMGTGKTRTALEIIRLRIEAGKIDSVIWLCPCSVKANLMADIKKHSDLADSGILTICGIETLSTSVRENSRLLGIANTKTVMLIVDESSMVKNHVALRSIHITRLAEMCKYRMILNGTPISKNEADLFSQWYLLDKRVLGYNSFWSFAANHLEYDERRPDRIKRTLNIGYLAEKIAPYTYEKKKADCLVLPRKNNGIYRFRLTNDQEYNYYEVLMAYTDGDVMGGEYDSIAVYRLLGALQQVASGRYVVPDGTKAMRHTPMFKRAIDNPRIQALLDAIDYFDIKGKIVVWYKYYHELDSIKEALEGKGLTTAEFHGGLSLKARNANIEKFCGDAQFLIANKSCAGFGLNLQFCHNAIYYTNDWDWATRAQSEDRLHRIGQDSQVNIVDLCSSAKIDERILNCLGRKENLSEKFKKELKQKGSLISLLGGNSFDDMIEAENDRL